MLKKSIYAFLLMFSLSQYASAEVMKVKFAYVGDEDHAALLGVKQGLQEANLQGQFLNQEYTLTIVPDSEVETHDFSNYVAIATAVEAGEFKQLTVKLKNIPVFNLNNRDNELRAACIDNALHVIPSLRMNEDALAQWRKKEIGSNATIQAWHADFVKFAARDLNKRFKKKYAVKMNDYSWAGWAAIKMATDTVARTQINEPKKMLDYLKSMLIFDGQKGINMTFRKTGQLRQLLLIVEDDEIIAEAPVRGIANSLDSLGRLSCD